MFSHHNRESSTTEQPGPGMPQEGTTELNATSSQQLLDLSALRTVLSGQSVVDGGQLYFPNRQSVDGFLRLSGFDTDNPMEMERLREIHREALAYLSEEHRYDLPIRVRQPEDIHQLFLDASAADPDLQKSACLVLKAMHILHHISVRELVFTTPVSEADLLERLHTRVFETIDAMRASGIGISEFGAGKKTRNSLTTKLLAKRESLAAHIFDRLRFRVVVNKREELVGALLYLLRHLIPFNYVTPGQSINDILTLDDVASGLQLPYDTVKEHWDTHQGLVTESTVAPTVNDFSGPTYRCINFVAELPLRIDDVAPDHRPAIAFAQTEIQLVDMETDAANQVGQNAHHLYKKRQRDSVRQRIEGGNTTAPHPRFTDDVD